MRQTEVRYWLCLKTWRLKLWKDKYITLSFDRLIDRDDISEVVKDQVSEVESN